MRPAWPVRIDLVTKRGQEAGVVPSTEAVAEVADGHRGDGRAHHGRQRRQVAPVIPGPGRRRHGRGGRRRTGPIISAPSWHGSPTSLGSGVEPSDVVDVRQPVGVFQVEQGIQRPVQVISEVRDLLLQAVSRVRGYSPRRLPDRSMVKSLPQAGQETAARVWPSALTRPVEVLQEGQVGGEEVLDDAGVHVIDAAQPGDDPREQDHGQVGGVLPDAVVAQRDQLVPGRWPAASLRHGERSRRRRRSRAGG